MTEQKQTTPVDMSKADAGTPEAGEAKRVRNKYADRMNRPKKRLPTPVKVIIVVVVIALVVTGAMLILHNTKQAAQAATDTQTTAIAMRQPLETYVEGSGRTAAKNNADLGKDVKGEVIEVNVKVGDIVKTGDILFVVDPEETRKDLDTATGELDDAMRAVDEASANVDKAQKDVAHLTITAPFSGKMLPATDSDGNAIDFKVGKNLSAGTLLGTMVDDSTMRLPLYFNNAYLNDIKVGAPVTVSIPASMSTVTGRVESVERVQKVSDDGALLFRANITMKNPGSLKKGMDATASVATGSGTIVPAEAGKLEYIREEEITAEGSGDIVSIGTLDNYRYQAGASICRLSNDDMANAVGTAQRSLESARKALETKQERVAELQKQIEESTVRSTIDGVVTSITVIVGQKLEKSTSAPCTVADLSSIVINADISELDVDNVKSGMPVIITMDNDDSIQYTGTVTSISMKATTTEGGGNGKGQTVTFPAVIELNGRVGDGMETGGNMAGAAEAGADTAGAAPTTGDAASLNLSPDRSVSYKIISASAPDAIVVPSTAVVYTESGAAVYAKPAEGETFDNMLPSPEGSDVPEGFVLVSVQTGISDDTNTQITAGLNEGVEVYLAGPTDPYADMGSMSVAVG